MDIVLNIGDGVTATLSADNDAEIFYTLREQGLLGLVANNYYFSRANNTYYEISKMTDEHVVNAIHARVSSLLREYADSDELVFAQMVTDILVNVPDNDNQTYNVVMGLMDEFVKRNLVRQVNGIKSCVCGKTEVRTSEDSFDSEIDNINESGMDAQLPPMMRSIQDFGSNFTINNKPVG